MACSVEDGEAKTLGLSHVPLVSLTSVPQSGLRPRPAYCEPRAPGGTPRRPAVCPRNRGLPRARAAAGRLPRGQEP